MIRCQNRSVSILGRVAFIVLFFIAGQSDGFGQANTGEIGGIVKDASGGILPGAAVTARHPASGLVLEQVTEADGRFFFPALRIGEWEVAAVTAGFSRQTGRITLEIGRTLALDFALAVGGLAEQVTVETRVPFLQTRNASKTARWCSCR